MTWPLIKVRPNLVARNGKWQRVVARLFNEQQPMKQRVTRLKSGRASRLPK